MHTQVQKTGIELWNSSLGFATVQPAAQRGANQSQLSKHSDSCPSRAGKHESNRHKAESGAADAAVLRDSRGLRRSAALLKHPAIAHAHSSH